MYFKILSNVRPWREKTFIGLFQFSKIAKSYKVVSTILVRYIDHNIRIIFNQLISIEKFLALACMRLFVNKLIAVLAFTFVLYAQNVCESKVFILQYSFLKNILQLRARCQALAVEYHKKNRLRHTASRDTATHEHWRKKLLVTNCFQTCFVSTTLFSAISY